MVIVEDVEVIVGAEEAVGTLISVMAMLFNDVNCQPADSSSLGLVIIAIRAGQEVGFIACLMNLVEVQVFLEDRCVAGVERAGRSHALEHGSQAFMVTQHLVGNFGGF